MNADQKTQQALLADLLGSNWLTYGQLCKKLNISRRTAQRMKNDGILPHPIELGGKLKRFSPHEIIAHFMKRDGGLAPPSSKCGPGRPRKKLTLSN